MRTTRVSAFPYRLGPRIMAISTSSVGRVRERGQEQRDVVVLIGVGDPERDHDLGVEGLSSYAGEIRCRVEYQPIFARVERAMYQLSHPTVHLRQGLARQ